MINIHLNIQYIHNLLILLIFKNRTMIGPHYQKLAQIQRKMTGKHMLDRIQSKTDNPLHQIIDKLKKQFNQYDTAYTQDIVNHEISSVDRLLSYDSKLGPILNTLEKENNLLRREVSVLENQLSNTVGICEQLVEETTEQKKIIVMKNADITKIIETVACNQSEIRNQLEEKIVLLQQENSILIQHMEEAKVAHQGYIAKFQEKDQEILAWKAKWEEAKRNLNQAIMKEHDLSRKLSLSQQKLHQQSQTLYTTQTTLQSLTLQHNDLINQLQLLKSCHKQSNIDLIKHRLQQQYKQIVSQHHSLKRQAQQLKRQAQRNKKEKEDIQGQFRTFENKFTKLLKDYQVATNMLQENKHKNVTMGAAMGKLEEKLDQYKKENVYLKAEVEGLREMMVGKEKGLQAEIEDLRRQLFEKSQNGQQKLREIRAKTQQILDAKDMELQSLNQTNNQLRRIMGHH